MSRVIGYLLRFDLVSDERDWWGGRFDLKEQLCKNHVYIQRISDKEDNHLAVLS